MDIRAIFDPYEIERIYLKPRSSLQLFYKIKPYFRRNKKKEILDYKKSQT